MTDFSDITVVNQLLVDAQEAEYDNREKVREVVHFLNKPDGQWEPSVIQTFSSKPRYTFDQCTPVVDAISGEMRQAEFGIKIRPAGGEATKDLALTMDGLIRNIQSMSSAKAVFNAAGKKMVAAGFDAWRVTHDWGDTDSFEQDLFIRKIANVVDKVWFDTGAEQQDMSDAKWCVVLEALTMAEYKDRFPDGTGQSVGDMRSTEVYSYKAEFVMVGEFLYKKPIDKELVLMSDNSVYEMDEKFEKVKDELAAKGITEVRHRTKKSHIVTTRFFDGQKFLSEEKDTVFGFIPIIPTYGDFDVSENKVVYRGIVNKLMDAQRVLNYAESRKIAEGALAPRGKYWMTREQAKSDQDTLQTMNTNDDPVQLYSHVEGQQTPFWQGGAQINAGLAETSAGMKDLIQRSSGIFSANQGNAPRQSGFAIELQQNKGDTMTTKYFESQEIAICHTARVLMDAIPRVYDTKRTVRILGEDGTSKMTQINDEIFDEESREMVPLNDLRKGKYDVTCDVGPAFKNRQQETARAFLEAAGIDPTLITESGDIWLRNLMVPGFDLIADRKRKKLFEAGAIPDDQMTDEEKEKAQQIIAQAQAEQAAAAQQGPTVVEQAMIEQTEANTADTLSKAMERNAKAVQADRKGDLEDAKFAAELDQQLFENIQSQQENLIKAVNTQADTLTKLVEALGAKGLVGPHTIKAGVQQAEVVTEAQERLPSEHETAGQ